MLKLIWRSVMQGGGKTPFDGGKTPFDGGKTPFEVSSPTSATARESELI